MINLQYPSNLPSELQGVQLVDLRESLPVNPNYTWLQLTGIRPIIDLTTIVCHHDAIPKQKSIDYTDIQLASNIATAHINSKKNRSTGDPGFPYDVWIRNGIIYFTNYVEVFEYGVASNNSYTVNVCVSGEYANYDTLTDADRKALYVAYFMIKSVMPAYKAVKGHKEITPTQCPGYDLNRVRADLTDLQHKMDYQQSEEFRDKAAYTVANQTLYLYNLAQKGTEAQAKWAKMELVKMYPYMKENGLLG